MSRLEKLTDSIWHVAISHAFMGLHVGTRMTVVKLSSGGLLLHSPVPVDEDLAAELACLLYTSPSPRDATLSRMPSSA